MPRDYRFSNKYTQKFGDIVSHKSVIELQYDSKILIDRLLDCLKPITRKAAAEYIGALLFETVAPYVPYKTGKLLKQGMYLSTRTMQAHAEVDLRVRNTSKVKYAFYQYYGRVWGPNYAVFEQQKFDPTNLKMTHSPATHTGWISPKGAGSKHPTHYVLGEKRTIHLKDGRVIHIDGYTNPQSHAMWLDYVRRTPTIWVPYTQRVQREIKEVFHYSWYNKRPIAHFRKMRSTNLRATGEIFNPKS